VGKIHAEELKTIVFDNNEASIKSGTINERLEKALTTRLNGTRVFFTHTDESRNISLCATFLE
jgi:hypothetical protein